jgi:hypothetical protein
MRYRKNRYPRLWKFVGFGRPQQISLDRCVDCSTVADRVVQSRERVGLAAAELGNQGQNGRRVDRFAVKPPQRHRHVLAQRTA